MGRVALRTTSWVLAGAGELLFQSAAACQRSEAGRGTAFAWRDESAVKVSCIGTSWSTQDRISLKPAQASKGERTETDEALRVRVTRREASQMPGSRAIQQLMPSKGQSTEPRKHNPDPPPGSAARRRQCQHQRAAAAAAGVDQQQHGDADGACAHRGERDQACRSPRPAARGRLQWRGRVTSPVWALRAAFWAASALGRKNNRLVGVAAAVSSRAKAQRGGHDALELLRWPGQGVQRPQRQQGGQNAARARLAHHFPGHQALADQADGAAHLEMKAGPRTANRCPRPAWGLMPKKDEDRASFEPPPTPVSPTIRPRENPQRQTPIHAWRRM